MPLAIRSALPPASSFNPVAQGGAARPRKPAWLRRAAALASLLALSAAQQALAFPAPLGFNNIASLFSTGGIVLTGPTDAAITADETVYIANGGANNIVKVLPDGTASIFNVSGVGTFNFPACDALDSAGNLYISDLGNARIVKVTPAGVGSVVNTGAVTLVAPAGIAVDYNGTIFVADIGNNTIVEVPAHENAATLAITGVGGLSSPNGVSVDTSGNLYIADSGNSRIVVVAGASTGASAGTVLNIIGPVLDTPHGVTTDNAGTVYIDDTNNTRVVKVAPDGTGTVMSTPQLGFAINDHLKRSLSGKLYIADQGANQIVTIQDTSVDFGKLPVGSSTRSNQTLRFTIPPTVTVRSVKILTNGADSLDFVEGNAAPCIRRGVAVNCAPINNDCVGATGTTCKVGVDFLPTAPGLRRGAVVLRDGRGHPIISVPLHGWGSAPVAAVYPATASVVNTGGVPLPGAFQSAFDGAGNHYVATLEVPTVYKIPAHGGSATPVNTGGYTLAEPSGVAVDGAGNLFISDYLNARIVVVSADGAVNQLVVNNLSNPGYAPVTLYFDATGTLYVVDYGNGRVIRVSGLIVTDSGASGNGAVVPTNGFTFNPGSLVSDAIDAQGNLYLVDYQRTRVIKVDASGAASVVTVPGQTLAQPFGVGTDMVGNLYIFDYAADSIFQLTPDGTASAVVLPESLGQYYAYDMMVSPTGNLYVDDFATGRVIELNVGMPAPMQFPATDIGSLSTVLTASLMNLGDLDLTLTGAPAYPAIFPEATSVSGRCGGSTVLASGESCAIAAAFAPNAVGVATADITVEDNSLNVFPSFQAIRASGKGIGHAAVWLSASEVDFGDESVGSTSTTRTVTLQNQGQAPLNIRHITVSGDFSQTNTCGSTVAVAGLCSINISFSPSASGARGGTISIVSSASSSPNLINLTGNGIDPAVSLSAASLDFGQTINNQLTSRTLTVTNSGTGMLLIEQVTAPKGFTVSSNCSSLPAGASCQILIVFRANKVGTITGELTIKSNAAKGTTRVALSGTNLAVPVNGSGAGAMGEDVLGMLAFAAWLRRRMKSRGVN